MWAPRRCRVSRASCSESPARTGANGRIHLSLDDPLPAFLVGLEHVLDVQVAEQLAVVARDREPAEAGGGAHVLDVGGGGARRTVVSVSGGISTAATVLLGEAERAGEPVVLVLREQALAAGLLDERGDLLAGVGGAHLVLQLDARQPEDPSTPRR